MSNECIDLDQYYFGTPASTLIGAVAGGTDPVTTSDGGSLIKDDFIGGITLIEAFNSFLGNSAVTTSAYLQYADKLLNGSAVLSLPLSKDVENIGARLKLVAQDLVQLNKQAANLVKAYNSSGLSGIIGSIPSSSVVYGCNLTQSKLVSGIVLVQQLQNFLNNSAVSTGDYLSTVSNLVLGS